MALDAAAEKRSRAHHRKHQSPEKREQQPRLLAGLALAGTGPDERSERSGDRLLVRYVGISGAARSEGGREHSIAAHLGKERDAAGGHGRAAVRLGPATLGDLGDYG